MKEKTIEKRAGFTQGPWHVQLLTFQDTALSEPKKLPYAIFDNNIDVIARGHEERDARLIAQAPAMYQQCKLFEKVLVHLQMQGETGVDEELENVRELLASVEGGEG